MIRRLPRLACGTLLLLAAWPGFAAAQTRIDLRTREGVEQIKGEWKFKDVKIVEVVGKAPDGSANTTYNIDPPSREVIKPDYDVSGWETVDPTTLGKPRSNGQVCFSWYRIFVTLPDGVSGKKVKFVTTVDDYGEVWVNDKLPRTLGKGGGAIVGGFNTPNEVELPEPEPGKTYLLSIFGINGPISAAPGNWIFLRDTYLEISEP